MIALLAPQATTATLNTGKGPRRELSVSLGHNTEMVNECQFIPLSACHDSDDRVAIHTATPAHAILSPHSAADNAPHSTCIKMQLNLTLPIVWVRK